MSDAKWDDHNYVKVYELARTGLSKMKIAKALNVSWPTFRKWMRKKPALKNALVNAKQSREAVDRGEFQDYVYQRLPANLRQLWKKIHKASKKENSIEYVEELLKDQGKQTRQRLFLYAFVRYNFNTTAACRALNMKPKMVENWIMREPEFADIMKEMENAKDDLIEGSLLQLVKNLDPGTVRMAAEARLGGRGYGKKVNVSHDGMVTQRHEFVPVEELDLGKDDLRKLLDSMRRRQQGAIEDKKDVVDAEFTVRKKK